MDRRRFVQALGAMPALGGMPGWRRPSSRRSLESIGLQLWTVREQLAVDPYSTLRAVAQIGYASVQTDLVVLQEVSLILQELGLQIRGAHVSGELVVDTPDELEPTLTGLAEHDVGFVVANSPIRFLDSPQTTGRRPSEYVNFYEAFAEALGRASEICRAAGMRLGFHPHSAEYQPLIDASALEILSASLSADELFIEVDVLWASLGGRDPVSVIRAFGPRCRSLHLRDRATGFADTFDTLSLIVRGDIVSRPIGDGTLDVPTIVSVAQDVGVEHWCVEQDFFIDDPFEELRRSHAYVTAL